MNNFICLLAPIHLKYHFISDQILLAENISIYSACNENEFACVDEQNNCVPRSAVCDKIHDCENGSDEEASICECTSDQVSFNIRIVSVNQRYILSVQIE